MISYPTDVPLTEIKDVISTIKNRSFATNGQKFAKDVWIISGFALANSVGEIPTTFGVVQSSGPPLTDDEAVAHLEQVVASATPGVVGSLPGTILAAVPWKQILQWALTQLITLTA